MHGVATFTQTYMCLCVCACVCSCEDSCIYLHINVGTWPIIQILPKIDLIWLEAIKIDAAMVITHKGTTNHNVNIYHAHWYIDTQKRSKANDNTALAQVRSSSLADILTYDRP